MGTETTTTIKETEGGGGVDAEKAAQAETAARGALEAADAVKRQAAEATAQAVGTAAAAMTEAKVQNEELAQWTKSQITDFHTRLGSLESEVHSLPDRLASILSKPEKKPEEPPTVEPEKAANAQSGSTPGEKTKTQSPPRPKRRFI
jgi:hypothetical protein